jgi:hypothetical protein
MANRARVLLRRVDISDCPHFVKSPATGRDAIF